MNPVRTALVGISGIGGYHRQLLHEAPYAELVATADRFLERPAVQEAAQELQEWNIPVYTDIWQMLDKEEVEAVVIAAPHPFHAPYTAGCVERGLHVLCEKPVTVLGTDGLRNVQLAQKKGRFVAVDFQYTGYRHSLMLKEMICDGALGELKEIVGVMEWKRTDEYYKRSDWVGKRFYEGLPCFDGVLMNQAVHLLNSALQMGTRAPGHALPERLQAELYRVHEIECEDVACLRADLEEATLHFYATTCCEADCRTTLEIIGTKGRARWNTSQAIVEIQGQEPIVLNMPTNRDAIHANLMNCIRGLEKTLLAPASEAVKATLTINGAYLSAASIPRVSWEELGDIRSIMDQAAEKRQLFSEMDIPWARAGEIIEQADFVRFNGVLEDEP